MRALLPRLLPALVPAAAALLFALSGCGTKTGGSAADSTATMTTDGGKQVTIGLSLATLKEERWQRDRAFFEAEAARLGAKLIVQSANTDDKTQTAQCENMLTQGVDVLVVVPNNGKVAASIVESAHQSGVKVISYDRLILDSDVDLYLSVDPVKVGEQQAQYLVDRAPKGNYIIILGDATDNNAALLQQGQQHVLKPYIDRGDIKIVTQQNAEGWQPIKALNITENALTRSNNQITAILASNDGTASGAIQALAQQGLAGKVLVTGQDAELAAMQRIVAGTQSMTIYKPVKTLAERAVQLAIDLAHGKAIPDATGRVNNGKIDVPAVLIPPTPVDSTNIMQTVVAEGYLKADDIYKDVPVAQRPTMPQSR